MFINSNFNSGRMGGGGLGCLVFGILGLVIGYFVLKGLFTVLMWVAPVLFVLALVINWKSVALTGKVFLDLLRRNPLAGLLVGALGVVGFPVLALYLFLQALGYNKLISLRSQFGGGGPFDRGAPKAEEEYAEYEELESRPKNAPKEPEPLEPPPPAPQKEGEKRGENPYDKMF